MKLVNWIAFLMFLTVSFDTVLVLKAGGNLRLAQVLLVLLIVASLAQILQSRVVLWPRGATPMAWFCLVHLLLLVISTQLFFSIELYLLLLLSVLGILAMVQLYGRAASIAGLMRNYLYSYVFIAIFGMIQFVSPALHLGQPLVVQWIKHGVIPRISGFSFEPSYFATYMIMGWIAVVDLRITRARLTSGRQWLWFAWLMTIVLICSTSKTAWLGMLLEGALRLLPLLWRTLRVQMVRLRVGSLVAPLPRLRAVAAVGLVMVLSAAALGAVSRVVDLNVFLAGSGLNGTAAHSLNDRANRYGETLVVWRESPWVGYSFGGVSEIVAKLEGKEVQNRDDLKRYQGSPVVLDVLAASGIVGFVPFVWFFAVITFGELRLMREHWADDRAKWLHALIRALAFEGFVLLSDQYLFRVYLWIHIAMIAVVGYHLRYSTARRELAVETLVAA